MHKPTAPVKKPVCVYPLAWPPGRRRTLRSRIEHGSPFYKGFEAAYDSVHDELLKLGRAHGLTELRISTNAKLRRDGLPSVVSAWRVRDAGVAVHFKRDGKAYDVACDTYNDVRSNLCALARNLRDRGAAIRDRVMTVETAIESWASATAPPKSDPLPSPASRGLEAAHA